MGRQRCWHACNEGNQGKVQHEEVGAQIPGVGLVSCYERTLPLPNPASYPNPASMHPRRSAHAWFRGCRHAGGTTVVLPLLAQRGPYPRFAP